jgi:hypothetical protein
MSIVTSPQGYPKILLSDGQTQEFWLASKFEGVKKNKTIAPVIISNLNNMFGCREKTHRFLKRFGQDWCISNGMIFFRKDCKIHNDDQAQAQSIQQYPK